VQRAKDHFGNLDVVINNSGYGLFGAIGDLAEKAVRNVFEANVFGALWITQAALPILRE
jgi:NAD(P)-dependent dehydrogenase (short-subunit alcohol dehydrogenase family)